LIIIRYTIRMNIIPFLVLVDDDEATNVYNEAIIEDSGLVNKYEIYDSSLSVINLFSNFEVSPTTILIDINMPKMNGWELVEKLSELLPKNNNLHIYMLSTSLSPKDKEMVKQHQLVQGYFNKPLTEAHLETLANEHTN